MTIRNRSRSVARLAVLGLAAALLLPSPHASATPTATYVRLIRTLDWSPPSTDPTGLAYVPNRDGLVVVDSEVDEGPYFHGKNVWFSSLRGKVQVSFSTMRFSAEPTDVAVGGRGGLLYFSDDNLDRVFMLKKGGDNRFGTADDVVTSFATRPFGSNDPAGLAFGKQSLWVTDGDNLVSDERVYRIRRGPNGVFDGVAPEGDDIVSHFSTTGLGLRRPTDVAYDAATRHLFIVSALDDVIVETTMRGVLVASYDFSGSKLVYPAGVAMAPASNGSGAPHAYVADRRFDNDDYPNENDGRIFEFSLTP